MVLTVLKGLGKAYLKSQKSVAPFSKTGGKSVAEWKSKAAKAKLKMAEFKLDQTLTKTEKSLKKAVESAKKIEKELKKPRKTKHYYASEDF